MASAKAFCVRIGGQEFGPLTAAELCTLADQGSLNGPFEVSIDGQPWQNAAIRGGQLHLQAPMAPGVADSLANPAEKKPLDGLPPAGDASLPPSPGKGGGEGATAPAGMQAALRVLWREYKILICGGAAITVALAAGFISWALTPSDQADVASSGSLEFHSPSDARSTRSSVAPKGSTDRVIAAIYSPTLGSPKEQGYAGFTFGESRDAIGKRLKPLPCLIAGKVECHRCGVARPGDDRSEPCPKQPIENPSLAKEWTDVEGNVSLLFDDDRVVGISRNYDFSARDSFKALFERFGQPPEASITHLKPIPVLRGGLEGLSYDTVLIRYCFQNMFVSATVWQDPRNTRNRGLYVGAFDRAYLESQMRRDIAMKEAILVALLPAIRHALGSTVDWGGIPFPTIEGTSRDHGTLEYHRCKYAALRGRETQRDLHGNDAVLVREEKKFIGAEHRSVGASVTVHFDSFPTYPHPLPPALRSLSHEVTLANLHLCRELFPGRDGQMESGTGWDHRGEYRWCTWTTSDQWGIRVEGFNKVVIWRVDGPRLD